MAQELLMINPRRKKRRGMTKAKRARAARLGWRRRKHRGGAKRRLHRAARRMIRRRSRR